MTEKRFVPIFDGFDKRVVGAKDNGVIISFMDMFDLLNELHEENEQLRHDATILIQSNQDYRKENEQLKKQLMDCEKFRHTVFQEISKEMSKHD